MNTATESEVDKETAQGGVTLSEFHAMSHDAKMEFIRSGADLLDDPKVVEPEKAPQETTAQRVERELEGLRETGIVKKALPTITMSTFDELSPRAKMDFIKGGGKLMDDPPAPKVKLPDGAVTLSAFERMTHEQKLAFARSRQRLYDDPVKVDTPPGTSELDEIKRKLKIGN